MSNLNPDATHTPPAWDELRKTDLNVKFRAHLERKHHSVGQNPSLQLSGMNLHAPDHPLNPHQEPTLSSTNDQFPTDLQPQARYSPQHSLPLPSEAYDPPRKYLEARVDQPQPLDYLSGLDDLPCSMHDMADYHDPARSSSYLPRIPPNYVVRRTNRNATKRSNPSRTYYSPITSSMEVSSTIIDLPLAGSAIQWSQAEYRPIRPLSPVANEEMFSASFPFEAQTRSVFEFDVEDDDVEGVSPRIPESVAQPADQAPPKSDKKPVCSLPQADDDVELNNGNETKVHNRLSPLEVHGDSALSAAAHPLATSKEADRGLTAPELLERGETSAETDLDPTGPTAFPSDSPDASTKSSLADEPSGVGNWPLTRRSSRTQLEGTLRTEDESELRKEDTSTRSSGLQASAHSEIDIREMPHSDTSTRPEPSKSTQKKKKKKKQKDSKLTRPNPDPDADDEFLEASIAKNQKERKDTYYETWDRRLWPPISSKPVPPSNMQVSPGFSDNPGNPLQALVDSGQYNSKLKQTLTEETTQLANDSHLRRILGIEAEHSTSHRLFNPARVLQIWNLLSKKEQSAIPFPSDCSRGAYDKSEREKLIEFVPRYLAWQSTNYQSVARNFSRTTCPTLTRHRHGPGQAIDDLLMTGGGELMLQRVIVRGSYLSRLERERVGKGSDE